MKNRISALEEMITVCRNDYYNGSPSITDSEFDKLVDILRYLDPNSKILKQTGSKPVREPVKLEVPMFSLTKCKTIKELEKWFETCITKDKTVIITPKLDSISGLHTTHGEKTLTRGDGIEGEDITIPFSFCKKPKNRLPHPVVGEIILPKEIWEKKVKPTLKKISHPRNIVSGYFGADTYREEIQWVEFIGYELPNSTFSTKEEDLIVLNQSFNNTAIPYFVSDFKGLSVEFLKSLYDLWSKDFTIDGLVIEFNDKGNRELGRDREENPKWAVAYKGSFEERGVTKVLGIGAEVSAFGTLCPTVQIEPIELSGCEMKNPTGHNVKNLLDNKIGEGAIIEVIRSGEVIPKIVSVEVPSEVPLSFKGIGVCEGCTKEPMIIGVDWVCQNPKCDSWVGSRISHFFTSLGIENHSAIFFIKLTKNFVNLNLNYLLSFYKNEPLFTKVFLKIEGFGELKLGLFRKELDKIKQTTYSINKIRYASACYDGIGEATFDKIPYDVFDENINYQDFLSINGVGEIIIKKLQEGDILFRKWYKDNSIESHLNIDKSVKKIEPTNLEEACVSKFRPTEQEVAIMKEKGYNLTDKFTKKTKILVIPDISLTSNKIEKAKKDGVKVITREDLINGTF